MVQFAFMKVIFVSGVAAIVLQCAVYPVRRFLGMAAARRLLSMSLFGFLAIVVACLAFGASNGQLARGLALGGFKTLADTAMFFGFSIFITYFMGARYLADELERAKGGGSEGSGEPAASSEPASSGDRDGRR